MISWLIEANLVGFRLCICECVWIDVMDTQASDCPKTKLRQSSSSGGDKTEEYELVTIKAERFDEKSAEKEHDKSLVSRKQEKNNNTRRNFYYSCRPKCHLHLRLVNEWMSTQRWIHLSLHVEHVPATVPFPTIS